VRFSLQDVKKSIHRRGGELSVSLHFLRPGELHMEIERLVAYYESLLGQPQSRFSLDEARACIGDYRLAHCLLATLSNWYNWRPREWNAVVQDLPTPPLFENISSPVHLRLALYTYVNEHHQGFLDAQTRAKALQALAGSYNISVADLEYLLALDSETEMLLSRTIVPTAQEVATLYNQWAFESALFNAASVHFVIDCRAFGRQQSDDPIPATITTGAGMVIKRLCFLARKLGVYYDLAYDDDTASASMLAGRDEPMRLHLTLYGPQDVTGAPQQYGLRLARLCRSLLAYGVAGGERAKKGRSLSTAIVEAHATVHFLQRAYNFNMDAQLLALLPGEVNQDTTRADASALFDSSIEQAFSEAFAALADSQGVDGWCLEREPEPLLLPASIFIPDFALTRAQHRIYVEILGFWTPAYREKKVHKLQQLRGRDDLVLAIPIEAKDAFAAIANDFPIVYYAGQLSATEVLQLLRAYYDDFAARLALIDVSAVQAYVEREGFVPERLCYAQLHAYRRSELQQAAERVVDARVVFMPGIGLYSPGWLEQLKKSFIAWMPAARRATLSEVVREMRARWPVLSACEDATIEALLDLWPEVQIRRDSIFEAQVELVVDGLVDTQEPDVEELQSVAPAPTAKKLVRERRAAVKKHVAAEQEATQAGLWG
jgi:predicted nuclease of restriction endonuclease-like RecB superfamily